MIGTVLIVVPTLIIMAVVSFMAGWTMGYSYGEADEWDRWRKRGWKINEEDELT